MMLEPERQQVILVDHNERSQAVEGIEETQILEIIDHHRLGGLTTGAPIYIRQEPVGSTATIIANMMWNHDIGMVCRYGFGYVVFPFPYYDGGGPGRGQTAGNTGGH